MRIIRDAVAVVVTLAVVAVVTAVLWHLKLTAFGPHHPIFCYLLPVALVAMTYGAIPAMMCAAVSAACSAYFLYDPVYSFSIANTLEWGDLICFAVLSLIGVKCVVELARPATKSPAPKFPYEETAVGAALRIATPTDPVP